jgi:hypothetical protein
MEACPWDCALIEVVLPKWVFFSIPQKTADRGNKGEPEKLAECRQERLEIDAVRVAQYVYVSPQPAIEKRYLFRSDKMTKEKLRIIEYCFSWV